MQFNCYQSNSNTIELTITKQHDNIIVLYVTTSLMQKTLDTCQDGKLVDMF